MLRHLYWWHIHPRDVVFDEKLFPFATNQSIVGVQYTSDVLLLPESFSGNNSGTNIDVSPACTVSPVPGSYVQTQVYDTTSLVSTGASARTTTSLASQCLAPSSAPGPTRLVPATTSAPSLIQRPTSARDVPDIASTPSSMRNAACTPGVDPTATATTPTAGLFQDTSTATTPAAAPLPDAPTATTPAAVPLPDTSTVTIPAASLDDAAVLHQAPDMVSVPRPTQDVAPSTCAAPAPAVRHVSPTADQMVLPHRTRLQGGIRKPKEFTDGTVRYGNVAISSEPLNLHEALTVPHWKMAMNDEYITLLLCGIRHRTLSLLNPTATSSITSGFSKSSTKQMAP
jgi:hypothetical protein